MSSIQIEIVATACSKCGIQYAVPADWIENRKKDGREFWCPNGHGQVFRKKDDKPTLEQRQELVLAVHRAEQAEARAAELAAGRGNSPSSQPLPDHTTRTPFYEHEQLGPVVKTIGFDGIEFELRGNERKRFCCPFCSKSYTYIDRAADHVKQHHPNEYRGIKQRQAATEASGK